MLGISDEGETEEQRQALEQMGLETIYIISPDGTFINPKVDDEIEDWGNRGKLLETYRKLKELMKEKRNFSDDVEQ